MIDEFVFACESLETPAHVKPLITNTEGGVVVDNFLTV